MPWPRVRTAERPSSCRSWASREGRCRRELNGGRARTCPATSNERCRPAMPSGPRRRTVTRSARRSPLRVGSRGVRSARRSPAGTRSRCRLPVAPAEGCQASRSQPLKVREPVLVASRVVLLGSPRRTCGEASRSRRSARGLPASRASRPTTTRQSSVHSQTVVAAGRTQHGHRPAEHQADEAAGHDHGRAVTGAPAPSRWRCRGPRPRRPPRARPRAAATGGGRASPAREP